jgi:hypothetical protein
LKATDGTSEPFQHQVISLLSLAGWLFGRYDNEFKMPDSVNPRNSMSYLSTLKPTTPERETAQHQTRPELTFRDNVLAICQGGRPKFLKFSHYEENGQSPRQGNPCEGSGNDFNPNASSPAGIPA